MTDRTFNTLCAFAMAVGFFVFLWSLNASIMLRFSETAQVSYAPEWSPLPVGKTE